MLSRFSDSFIYISIVLLLLIVVCLCWWLAVPNDKKSSSTPPKDVIIQDSLLDEAAEELALLEEFENADTADYDRVGAYDLGFEEYSDDSLTERYQQYKNPKKQEDAIYLVIAGAFKKKENAKKILENTRNLGYPAEILQFSNSPLYSVCVIKAASLAEARVVLDELQALKINAYIHKKRTKG